MNESRLTQGLDTDERALLGDLDTLEAHLADYEIPEPDTAALLAHLLPASATVTPVLPAWRHWLQLAEIQISLFNLRFWLATLLMFALGLLLIVTYGSGMLILCAVCSPVLAVMGTAYLFRPSTRTLHEFELFSVYSPLELLYTRVLLVMGYTIAVMLPLLLLAFLYDSSLVIWRLLLIWIGPMVGLAGVALYTTVRWNAFAGAALPMALWALMVSFGWIEIMSTYHFSHDFPRLLTTGLMQSSAVIWGALLSLITGVILIWRSGSWLTYGENL